MPRARLRAPLPQVASLGAGRSSQEEDCPRMDPRRRTWALRTRSAATRCGSSALRALSTALATLRTGLVGASWKATWPIHAAHTRIMRGLCWDFDVLDEALKVLSAALRFRLAAKNARCAKLLSLCGVLEAWRVQCRLRGSCPHPPRLLPPPSGAAVLSLSCYGQEGAQERCRGKAVK